MALQNSIGNHHILFCLLLIAKHSAAMYENTESIAHVGSIQPSHL